MTDILAFNGKAVFDKKVLINVLAMLEPTELTEQSTQYHIGYERAKADVLKVFGRMMGPEFSQSASVRLIKELRGG